jgi:hypothetical protein
MTNKRVRGRWNPTPEQISVAIDCADAVARVPLEKAAELIGVRPRTLRSFSKRDPCGAEGKGGKAGGR